MVFFPLKFLYSLSFRTEQLIDIRDWRLGLLSRVLQFVVVFYVVGYQVLYENRHLTPSSFNTEAFVGVSGTSDTVGLATLPSQQQILDCKPKELNRSKVFKIHATRSSVFGSVKQESPTSMFIPTMVQKREVRNACRGKTATRLREEMNAATEDCEVFTPGGYYSDIFKNEGMYSFDETSFVPDFDRVVLVIVHKPEVDENQAKKWYWGSDYVKTSFTDMEGFTQASAPGSKRIKIGEGQKLSAKEAVRLGKPFRKVTEEGTGLDYIPLRYLLEMAGVTTDWDKCNEANYLSQLSGFTLRLSLSHNTKNEHFRPFGSEQVEYVYQAHISSSRNFIYEEHTNFDQTVARVEKKFGVRISLVTSGQADGFSISAMLSNFLPEFMALLAVCNLVVQFLIMSDTMRFGKYGPRLLARFLALMSCRCRRGKREARSCWYYRYLIRPTVNLALLDNYLHWYHEVADQDEKQLISDSLAKDVKRRDIAGGAEEKSAFLDSREVVMHQMRYIQMDTQLNNFFEREVLKQMQKDKSLPRRLHSQDNFMSTSTEVEVMMDKLLNEGDEYASSGDSEIDSDDERRGGDQRSVSRSRE